MSASSGFNILPLRPSLFPPAFCTPFTPFPLPPAPPRQWSLCRPSPAPRPPVPRHPVPPSMPLWHKLFILSVMPPACRCPSRVRNRLPLPAVSRPLRKGARESGRNAPSRLPDFHPRSYRTPTLVPTGLSEGSPADAPGSLHPGVCPSPSVPPFASPRLPSSRLSAKC